MKVISVVEIYKDVEIRSIMERGGHRYFHVVYATDNRSFHWYSSTIESARAKARTILEWETKTSAAFVNYMNNSDDLNQELINSQHYILEGHKLEKKNESNEVV